MMHQKDILVAAFDSCGKLGDFNDELTKLFGSSFAKLSIDPSGGERARRKVWCPIASASEEKKCSQIEQRIVDVTLRDLLEIVHARPLVNKNGWRSLLDSLTASNNWGTVANNIQAIAGPPDEASGFFWSSVLASALGAMQLKGSGSVLPTEAILSFPKNASTVFDQARYPRAKSGNTVKTIKEMGKLGAREITGDIIANALAGSSIPLDEKRIVVAVIGAATSADLWRHPSAVRHLLLPAVQLLRGCGATFSLDSPSGLVEQIIYEELGQKWRARGVW